MAAGSTVMYYPRCSGLASDDNSDWCPTAAALGGCGEDSVPGPPAGPHRLPAPHTPPLSTTWQDGGGFTLFPLFFIFKENECRYSCLWCKCTQYAVV